MRIAREITPTDRCRTLLLGFFCTKGFQYPHGKTGIGLRLSTTMNRPDHGQVKDNPIGKKSRKKNGNISLPTKNGAEYDLCKKSIIVKELDTFTLTSI